MNDEMLRLFTEHEKTAGPPMGLDSDALARKGRTRLRARRFSAAGGATAAVALVATVAVALSGLSTPAPADQAAADGAEQPAYPLPDDLPEPPEKYFWSGYGGEQGKEPTSEAADAYGDAFLDWFAENGDDIEQWQGMAIKHRILLTKDDAETVDEPFPYYGIINTGAEDAVTYGGDDDAVGLRVYPRGNFKEGDGDTYEYLYTCEDGDYENDEPETLDYTCDEKIGPGGEKYVTVKTVHSGRGKTIRVENRVIVFREDGTAVDVRSWVHSGDSSVDHDPKLNFDELADLALSMPDAIVED